MTDAKSALEKIKQLFNELTAPVAAAAPAPPAPTVTEYELKDGGKVAIDKLEVGGIVMIDGAPALVGDLELADGTKITVGDNGVIAAIEVGSGMQPAEPVASPAGEDMGAKFSAFEQSATEKFSQYEARFAANEAKFAEYEAKLSKASEMIEKLLQFGQLMVEKPQAAPDAAARTSNTFKEQTGKSFDALFNS